MTYAHHGRRFVAFIVDLFIVGIPIFVGLFSLAFIYNPMGKASQTVNSLSQTILDFFQFLPGILLDQILIFFLVFFPIIYFVYFESGPFQGTLGKRWLKLKVVGENNQPLSVAQAFGRTFSKYISFIPFGLGFFMIIFQEKHQGLHGMLSKTYVVEADSIPILEKKIEAKEELAGFWQRTLAALIDGFLLGFLFILIIKLYVGLFHLLNIPYLSAQIYAYVFLFILLFVCKLLYFVGMETSTWQATVGKYMVGLVVIGEGGQVLTKKQALFRYLGKILSFLSLGIGFFLVGKTQKKQALHDILCQSVVRTKKG